MDHLRDAGFRVNAYDVADTTPIRRRAGLAPQHSSCHTGLIDGYAVEGHVPAEDIRRLLEVRPKAIGLAVPGMPMGSPGMDDSVHGGRRDPYDVLLVHADGSARVWRIVR